MGANTGSGWQVCAADLLSMSTLLKSSGVIYIFMLAFIKGAQFISLKHEKRLNIENNSNFFMGIKK